MNLAEKNNRTQQELECEAISHMADNGFIFEGSFDISGRTVKFSGRANGEKKREEKTEWYKAEQKINNGIVSLQVTYNSHHDSLKSDKNHVFFSGTNKPLNECEIKETRKRIIKLQQDREAQESIEEGNRRTKAIKDRERFNKASESGHSQYLERKSVKAHGIRFERKGTVEKEETIILIPMCDANGEIQAIQEIYPSKRILTGSTKLRDKNFTNAVKGLYHVLGKIKDGQPIRVSEGYATSASVYESTGCSIPHVVAFSAGGYEHVIPIFKKLYPNSPIIICADNNISYDPNKLNTGLEEARKAANQFGCSVIFPIFPEGKNKDKEGKYYADFNDLMLVLGTKEVQRQINPNVIVTSSVHEELKKLSFNLLEKEEPCGCFSLSDLPKSLVNYINGICETTNAHPIMVTSSVLTTVSAFLNKRVFIPEGEYFQTLYANLWLLNVTKSGQFKSTALNKGSKLAWERSKIATDKMKEIEKKIREESDKEKIKELENKMLEASLEDIVLPNKITAEALLSHLSLGHGGAIFTSEFGAWLQNFDKSHNTDLKAIFTELFDVPQSYRYKTKSQGDFILERPYFSICGVSTLSWLKANLKPDDVSSGFFARFLLFTPPHQDEIPPALPRIIKPSDPHAEWMIKQTLENIENSYSYKLSGLAKTQFESMHNQLYQMGRAYSENCQEILEPYLKRWSPYILKLAMIIRIFEDHTSKEISDTAINSAMAIILPAIKSTANLFEGELGESEHQRKCRIVFDWICQKFKKTSEPVKWKDIITSRKLEGGSAEYEYVCKTLIESGKLIFKENIIKKECLYAPNI